MDDANKTAISPQGLPEFPQRRTLRFLGKGGMAEVYLAQDDFLNRKVAIKVISAELSADEEFVLRFADEAKTVASFTHPNIVTVYSYGQMNDRPFIEMAFEPGGSLADKIRTSPLDADSSLEIAHKTLSALAYSHERGIIHRDVTPGNILFSGADEPILSDFGIAKAIDTSDHRTKTGLQIGSPRYMSPEQLRGERVNDRTDVFSMALVTHEMLTGVLPNRSVCSIRNDRDVREFEKALRMRNPDLSRFISYFSACFRDNPDERASAAECVELIAEIRDATKPDWRGRSFAAALGIGLTLLVTGTIYRFVIGPTADLDVELSPADAELTIDGKLTPDRSFQADKGTEYEFVAVAPGYVGQVWHLNLQADSRQEMRLQPLTLPGKDEHLAFDALFFEGASPDDVETKVEYPLYRTLLAMVALKTTDSFAFNAQQRDLETLANRNDPAAQLGMFLLVYAGHAPLREDVVLKMLQEASAGGYALASYFNAARFAQAYVDKTGGLSRAEMRRYRDLLKIAFDQGLSWAEETMLVVDEALDG